MVWTAEHFCDVEYRKTEQFNGILIIAPIQSGIDELGDFRHFVTQRMFSSLHLICRGMVRIVLTVRRYGIKHTHSFVFHAFARDSIRIHTFRPRCAC
jgi:hypothetical protein